MMLPCCWLSGLQVALHTVPFHRLYALRPALYRPGRGGGRAGGGARPGGGPCGGGGRDPVGEADGGGVGGIAGAAGMLRLVRGRARFGGR